MVKYGECLTYLGTGDLIFFLRPMVSHGKPPIVINITLLEQFLEKEPESEKRT